MIFPVTDLKTLLIVLSWKVNYFQWMVSCDREYLMGSDSNSDVTELAKQIEKELYESVGPLLFGEKLYSALGFSSSAAFRQALSRNYISIEIFSLPNRRGKFALSRDVARFLARQAIYGKTDKSESDD